MRQQVALTTARPDWPCPPEGLGHRQAGGPGRRPGAWSQLPLAAQSRGAHLCLASQETGRPARAPSLCQNIGVSGARPPRPTPGAQRLFLDLPLKLLHGHFFQHLRCRPEGPSQSRQVNQGWGRV